MLRAGDILFRKKPFHHTMMVTDPLDFGKGDWYENAEKLEIVHAATIDTHVYREVINLVSLDPDQLFTGYRMMNSDVAKIAKDYACVWAWMRIDGGKKWPPKTERLERIGQAKTFYSYVNPNDEEGNIARSRYYGVQEERASAGCPPFEFDALYRAVKWASRGRSPFSRNRGTTCCAFVTACHQAAVIDHLASGDWKKVLKALKFLVEARGIKDPERWTKYEKLGPKEQKVALGARRLANPGPMWREYSIDAYFSEVSFILCGKRLAVRDVFPPGLIVDAKFNYSANFEKMLASARSSYQRLF